MPSLDVVSVIDMQALDNAVNNVKREISTRFDFRNMKSEVTLDRKAKTIHIVSGDEWKVKTVSDMLVGQCVRLKVDPKSLSFADIETMSQTAAKREIEIKEGITKETAQKIVKYIKELKLKVQPIIQEDQVRISGKQIDDLQQIMRLLQEQDFGLPLQFVNLKR
jgi:cyclic-di-GMP-binding protein